MFELSITLLIVFGGISLAAVVVAWLSDFINDIVSMTSQPKQAQANIIVLPLDTASESALQNEDEQYAYPQAA